MFDHAADLAFRALLAIESGIIARVGQTARELGSANSSKAFSNYVVEMADA